MRAAAVDQVAAGGLALLVHLGFLATLVFGVSWTSLPAAPVYADLWQGLPAAAPPEPAPPAAVKAEPRHRPVPPASRPVSPVAAPAPPRPASKPDIALKAAAERAAARRAQEEVERKRRLDEAIQQLARERMQQEEAQLQLRREEERQAREKARRDLDATLAAEAAEALAVEAGALRRQAAATARLRLVDEYKGKIEMKVKGLLINPPSLSGRPEAVYRVDLLPNGEVVRAVLVKPSGQPAYDRAVEGAILKASPFPLPPDRDAAAAFRDGLELRFRPD